MRGSEFTPQTQLGGATEVCPILKTMSQNAFQCQLLRVLLGFGCKDWFKAALSLPSRTLEGDLNIPESSGVLRPPRLLLPGTQCVLSLCSPQSWGGRGAQWPETGLCDRRTPSRVELSEGSHNTVQDAGHQRTMPGTEERVALGDIQKEFAGLRAR